MVTLPPALFLAAPCLRVLCVSVFYTSGYATHYSNYHPSLASIAPGLSGILSPISARALRWGLLVRSFSCKSLPSPRVWKKSPLTAVSAFELFDPRAHPSNPCSCRRFITQNFIGGRKWTWPAILYPTYLHAVYPSPSVDSTR